MHNPTSDFQTVTFDQLESLCHGECPCCGEKWSPRNPPDLVGKCHPRGNIRAAYWDGHIYLECGECLKPIMRVAVQNDSRSLSE